MSTHCPGCHEGIKVYTKSALDTVPDHVHIYPCPGCGHEAEIAHLHALLAMEQQKPTLHFWSYKQDPTRGEIVLLWVKRDAWEDYRMILELERGRTP